MNLKFPLALIALSLSLTACGNKGPLVLPQAPVPTEAVVPAEEARRAADCAYLRAELDANRRLRNVLTTRRYYSTEDVEQMDAREAELAADYRRFCTR